MAAVAERAHTDILSGTPLASDPVSVTMPTGAMVTFRFDGAWKELHSTGATVLSFTNPKEIAPRLRG